MKFNAILNATPIKFSYYMDSQSLQCYTLNGTPQESKLWNGTSMQSMLY